MSSKLFKFLPKIESRIGFAAECDLGHIKFAIDVNGEAHIHPNL